METNRATDTAGTYTAILALTEVGLGSLLHAYRVPLAGQILSLNQGFLLSRATQETSKTGTASTVSLAAALLKSLSPAGKRLTPMLAISAQGLLYSLGTVIMGSGFLGQWLGFSLLSLWAYLQPVLVYYLLFGNTLVEVARYYWEQLNSVIAVAPEHLLAALAAMIALKLAAATALLILSFRLSEERWRQYLATLETYVQRHKLRFEPGPKPPMKERLRLVAGDLLQPWFIISIAMTFLFFFVTSQNRVHIVWGLLRPIALAMILFYVIRFINFEPLLERSRYSDRPLFRALRQALFYLKSR